MTLFQRKRPCLDCGRDLRKEGYRAALNRIECVCGLKYTKDLVDSADAREWNKIHKHRLFTRADDALTIESDIALLSTSTSRN